MTSWISRRVFDLALQESFARLSGDWNPLHVDPIAARRMLFGGPAVHGMHLVLWALEELAQRMPQRSRIRSLSASFTAPVLIDRSVTCSARLEGAAFDAHLDCGDRRAASVRATVEAEEAGIGLPPPRSEPLSREAPLETHPDELPNARGAFTLHLDPQHAAELFPALAARVPPVQVAEQTAVTRLVGMRCPGLRSLLSRVELEAHALQETPRATPDFRYRMHHFARKFQLARLEVHGPTSSGRVEAFVRPEGVNQAELSTVADHVRPGEFAGQRALIVGGSRGLGEVCAKLLAAGGADVTLTYRLGREDALRVRAEIASAGAKAAAMPLDVLDPELDIPAALPQGWRPTHLYYFATPFIFDGSRGRFSSERFDTFARYYVHGFGRILQTLLPDLRGVFYPSSTALDELPPAMGEYVAAKAAGEGLCAHFAASHPRIRFVLRRLPRLMTDQTQSLLPVANADPVPLMLDALRELASSTP